MNTIVDKALKINNLDAKLTPEEQKLRRYVMNSIIDMQVVFHMKSEKEMACHTLSFTEAIYDEVIQSMIEKNVISVDEEHINFIYPVSGFPTNHQITLAEGRKFHAMCGIDAMGTAHTFKTDVEITSCCAACGEPIQISMKDGALHHFSPETAHVLHVDLDKHDNWSGNC